MEGEPKNDLEMLKEIIALSPQKIESEFRGESGNTWLLCVRNRLLPMANYIEMAEMDKLISEDEKERLMDKIRQLTARVKELEKMYPEKSDEVPQEIKEEILSRLNILE